MRISFSGSFHLVRSFWFCTVQCVADLTSVIGMRCCSACCKFQVVTSYDTVYVTSADTSWCLRCDTARSHCTDTAADTLLTKFTMWSLFCCTVLPCVCSYFFPVSRSFSVAASNSSTVVNLKFPIIYLLVYGFLPHRFLISIRPHGIQVFEINPLTASPQGGCAL